MSTFNKNKKNLLTTTLKYKLIFKDEYNYADIDDDGLTYFDFFYIGMQERVATSNCVEIAWFLSFVKDLPNEIKNIKLTNIDLENAIQTMQLPIYHILGGDIMWNSMLYNAEWSKDYHIFVSLFEELIFNWILNCKTLNDLIVKIKETDIEKIFEILVSNNLINFNSI